VRRALAPLALVLAISPPLFLLSFRSAGGFRVELGGVDELYRTGSWGRDYQDHGPYRLRRGERRMTYFQARVAFDGAGLRLPAVVRGGDAVLSLRVHRYGQPGIVRLFAKGVELGRVVFERDSYPWEVRTIPVPSAFLEGGSLDVELKREETAPSVDLPTGAICAFDWVELAPRGGARLAPTGRQWLEALAIPIGVLLTLLATGASSALSACGALVASGLYAWAEAHAPGSACYAAARIWIAFPLGLLLSFALGKRAPRLGGGFALVLLASSTVLFWPDHLPPDVRPHLRQVARVASSDWTGESFWELSSSYGQEGRTLSLGRRIAGADYVAPYSPWSYFLVHGLRTFLDEPRFLVEYLSILLAALLVPLVYGLALTLSNDVHAAGLGALLAALEISIWHHASRAHMPALMGEASFVVCVLYLAARRDDFEKSARVPLSFAALSLLATLSYSATLLHFVVFIAWLVALECWSSRSLRPGATGRRWLAAAVAGTLGSVALFYRRFLGASKASAALHPEGYRAPARFFFLRNQPRDTLRILELGHPAFLALALPAYLRLRAWVPSDFSRRVVWAWTAAYATFLLAKDPIFFPGLFLQIKEDLFFAPLACALGGMTLARLVRAGGGRRGRLAAYALTALLFALRANDYRENAETIHPPAASE
jgi:hypothetical protein